MEFEITTGPDELKRGADDLVVGAETGCYGAGVNIVEFVGVEPWVFGVVNFEAAVGWDAGGVLVRVNKWEDGVWYNAGWIGLRSVPSTLAEGYWLAFVDVR